MLGPVGGAPIEVGAGGRPVLELEGGPAQEPVRLRVRLLGDGEAELVAGLDRPSHAEQGAGKLGARDDKPPEVVARLPASGHGPEPFIGRAAGLVARQLDLAEQHLRLRLPALAPLEPLGGLSRLGEAVEREVAAGELEQEVGAIGGVRDRGLPRRDRRADLATSRQGHAEQEPVLGLQRLLAEPLIDRHRRRVAPWRNEIRASSRIASGSLPRAFSRSRTSRVAVSKSPRS